MGNTSAVAECISKDDATFSPAARTRRPTLGLAVRSRIGAIPHGAEQALHDEAFFWTIRLGPSDVLRWWTFFGRTSAGRGGSLARTYCCESPQYSSLR